MYSQSKKNVEIQIIEQHLHSSTFKKLMLSILIFCIYYAIYDYNVLIYEWNRTIVFYTQC
jgi:hypothetical protein